MRKKSVGIVAWLVPAGALLSILPLAVVPFQLHPLAYGVAALATGLVLASVALFRRNLSSLASHLAVAGGIPLAVLLVASLLAAAPGVSLFGLYGQHSGWILYATMYLWLVCSIALAGSAALRYSTMTGALLCGALGAIAILEKLGVLKWASRYSPEPSGFLDNPTSMGQTLVVGLGCAVAWWLISRRAGRVGAVICGLLCVAGLALAGVTGTILAAVLGAAIALGGLWRPVKTERGVRIGAAVVVGLLVLVIAATLLASGPFVPAKTAAKLSTLSNFRTDIWATVWGVVAERPILGRGADQFGVWQAWQGTPNGELNVSATMDPHNALLAVLLAGGVLGLIAALSFFYLLVTKMLRAHMREPLPPAVLALIGAAGAFAVSTALAWVYLPAAVLAIGLLGTALGLAEQREGGPQPQPKAAPIAYWVLGGTAALSVAVLVWAAVAAVPSEIAYGTATRLGRGTGYPYMEAISAYERWPDPEYATAGLNGYFARYVNRESGFDAAALDLVRNTASTGRYDARTDFSRINVVQALSATTGRNELDVFKSVADDGRVADPATGFWDYASVLETLRLGRKADAARYARAALAHPQSEMNAVWLREVAAGRGKLQQ